jgi:molybdenum cofactor synthesis domain-containing protein
MIRVAVVTISDSSSAGTREDVSGPALEGRVLDLGWIMVDRRLVPDDVERIRAVFSALGNSGAVDVILSTGGTGITIRDVTPEAVKEIVEREIPGFGEVMRAEGRSITHMAALSRSSAYTLASTLIVTLPGSPRGAVDSLNAVADLIPHAVHLLHGQTEHHAKESK